MHPLRQGYAENAPLIDPHADLAKAGGGYELVHFRLGTPAHDPGQAFMVSGLGAVDQFQLRVPGLAGVDLIWTLFGGVGQSGE